jgi:protein SCO1/2
MFRRCHLLIAFVAALLPGGCGRAPSKPAGVEANGTKTYEVRGVLQRLTADGHRAVIAHEAIANYMPAMTMEFEAGEPAELKALAPGDVVAFRLSVTDTRGWIEGVRKIGTVPLEAVPELEPGPPSIALPDSAMIDEHGSTVRLRDFRGRALAFTFIFTRCPYPDFCPRMNRQFAEVQRALATAPDTNWNLLCISLDPEYDTPERLGEYVTQFAPDAAHWRFVTGDPAEIRALGEAVGLAVKREGGRIDHNLRTVVVDAAGRVQKIFAGNAWTPAELIAEMQRAMAAKP